MIKNIDISRSLTIQGWMTEPELSWLANQAKTKTAIVEIGCWKGRSTSALLDNSTCIVHAIDKWSGYYYFDGYRGNEVYKEFLANFVNDIHPKGRLQVYHADSADKACDFQSYGDVKFDMIFIDGDHRYNYIKSDLDLWLPLLADGGLICGHGYDEKHKGLQIAVNETFTQVRQIVGSIWQGVI